MKYHMGTLRGLKIYINENLYRDVPVRKHKDRGEVRRHRLFKSYLHKPSGYHKRVQKKLVKRYGVKREPYYLLGRNNTVFMPTEFFVMLKLPLEANKQMEDEFLYCKPGALEPREGGIIGKKITGVIIDDPLY